MEGEHTDQNICNYIQNMLSNLNITLDHVHIFCETMNKQNKKALLLVQDVDIWWSYYHILELN